jgi:hypothetical protein
MVSQSFLSHKVVKELKRYLVAEWLQYGDDWKESLPQPDDYDETCRQCFHASAIMTLGTE